MIPFQVWLGRNRGEWKCDIAWSESKERAMQLCGELNPGWKPFAVKDVSAQLTEPF